MRITGKILFFIVSFFLAVGCEKEKLTLYQDKPVAIFLHIDDGGFSTTKATNGPAYDRTMHSSEYLKTMEVKLTAVSGGFDWKRIEPYEDQENKIIKIFDPDRPIVNPLKLEIRANGGKESYISLDEPLTFKDYSVNPILERTVTLADASTSCTPYYGATEEFELKYINNNGAMVAEMQEDGTYLINAKIFLKIPIARMEVSNVHYGNVEDGSYSSMILRGIYLDMVPVTLEEPFNYPFYYESYENIKNAASCDWNDIVSKRPSFVMKIKSDGDLFLNGNHYPSEAGNSYSFNFFPIVRTSKNQNILPQLKFYFEDVNKKNEPSEYLYRYAYLVEYFDSRDHKNKLDRFEPGFVYILKDVEIMDENLYTSFTGSSQLNVYVDVVPWTEYNASKIDIIK